MFIDTQCFKFQTTLPKMMHLCENSFCVFCRQGFLYPQGLLVLFYPVMVISTFDVNLQCNNYALDIEKF